MTGWLRHTGHRTKSAGIRFNVDCSGRALAHLEERLEGLAESSGQRVAIVGQSRGGTFARAIAVRRPDLVSGIVCLGSPVLDPLAVNLVTRTGIFLVGALGTLGAPGFFGHRCRNGDCCETFWATVRAPFPANVGYLSIYSRSDGVIDYRACLDPAARRVAIDSSHIGMSVHAEAYRRIAGALAAFRRADAQRPEPAPVDRLESAA
jgi:pimeloyl-ACP methyl ester carboxylesterase